MDASDLAGNSNPPSESYEVLGLGIFGTPVAARLLKNVPIFFSLDSKPKLAGQVSTSPEGTIPRRR